MAKPLEQPWTVGALTQRIGTALEGFGPLLVQGELSQAKVYPSGHFYATLKDGDAVMSLVMWRSQVVRNGAIPKEGSQVVVRGSISVYAPRGQYQLVATRVTPVGQGDLAARFEQLKARLAAEGLFDEERKRPLPAFPRAVGLATAAGSAALADMLHSLKARFPRMPVVHAPCLVQGASAAASIVQALRRLDAHPEVDVIIVGRGGGSIEDLWAFNEEAVVRAIVACDTPVICAVGHETDVTLSDHAADVRAKTPTAAGEMAVPVEREVRDALADAHERLDQSIDVILAGARQRLEALVIHRALAGPGHQVAMRRQRLDELSTRLEEAGDFRFASERQRLDTLRLRLVTASPRHLLAIERDRWETARRSLRQAMSRTIDQARQRLGASAAHLDALSPLAVIGRGYSVVRTRDGDLVRRLEQATPGTLIDVRVVDGWIAAETTGTRVQKLNEPSDVYAPGSDDAADGRDGPHPGIAP
ncbi:MAG: exodeoxyribonuclease VII large subunit [Planctomycetes bacterium]|nr:exodeoxyribonuclease VII large subunit [Planctomycetota bacterium]